MVDDRFTAKALAAVRPACETGMKMIQQTMAIGDMAKALDVLASSEVFALLARLNPSLLDAFRWPCAASTLPSS
jgi:hypothetical protein